ncbi:reverse transcriptase domain-containing protein [Tanacetum coccineum]
MRTRSQTHNRNRRQQQQTLSVVVEPCNLEEPIPGQTIVAMADRTMEELLRAPTEGYGEAIVLPEINADHFEIKTNLLQLVQANPFHGLENENPHAHINSFKRITSTLRFRNVPNDVIKLMMFPYSLEGAAKTWICSGAKSKSNFQGSTAQIPPPVIPKPIPEPEIPKTLPKSTPIPEPEIPKTVPKANIPYPSRRDNQKNREKASYQKEKIFQMFQDLRFDISFADALFLMPRFAPTIRDLLMNKEKLLELVKIPLNENCSAMLLKKLPEKLGDPGKFLIPCEFPGMEICYALADLGASINLMPLSIWKKLSLPELSPTRMTLELADRSITYPKGLAEDVYVKVGKFHFPADFVVVDFEADPRVPLILGRSFLKTGRTLIDVYEGEITLRVDNEAVTFNLDQTMKYSSTNDKSVNRIDIIDEICEEYVPELLGFPSDDFSSGNPTSTSEPFTSEFTLEEIDAFLYDKSISLESDHDDCDPEEDIYVLEQLLNDDPFQLPPMDLKQSEVTEAKSSIEEPPELELKDLPSHLEYAFLEENDKLPVIIAKGLKNDQKEALINVLKSHKHAIAWKITDIKGINPRFCTHKILMEDDCKPSVQSQRRVNPKIHEVIKKEVIKLLDAGMIYPISDSPWVSPIHCVPKKGGMTVVANEENELIPTRLVTGWRVCIDYRKLNEATRKDHFPLPFMDQMLERLAGNEFYCFFLEAIISDPVPGIVARVQDEGQAGPNPGDAAASQPLSSHVIHAGPNLEHMNLEASDTSIQPNPKQMDEEFTTTAYPNVQENLKLLTKSEVRLEELASSTRILSSLQNLDKELSFADQFLMEKSQEDEPEKTNTESEVQSMVTIPIHQDTSSVPLITTPVIDLTVSQPVPTAVQAPLPTITATSTATATTTTTITTLPLPPQP